MATPCGVEDDDLLDDTVAGLSGRENQPTALNSQLATSGRPRDICMKCKQAPPVVGGGVRTLLVALRSIYMHMPRPWAVCMHNAAG